MPLTQRSFVYDLPTWLRGISGERLRGWPLRTSVGQCLVQGSPLLCGQSFSLGGSHHEEVFCTQGPQLSEGQGLLEEKEIGQYVWLTWIQLLSLGPRWSRYLIRSIGETINRANEYNNIEMKESSLKLRSDSQRTPLQECDECCLWIGRQRQGPPETSSRLRSGPLGDK